MGGAGDKNPCISRRKYRDLHLGPAVFKSKY